MEYFGVVPVLVLAIVCAIFAFEVIMFIDVIMNPKLSNTEKLLWAIGMLLLHPVIAIVYYFTARRNLR